MRVAGFGFRTAAGTDSLADALARAGGAAGLTALAAPADKAGAAALTDLATRLGLPVRAVAPDRLAAMPTLTEAPRIRAARATGSVAEAAALAAAGPGARLTAPRAISADRMATCAIASHPDPTPTPGAPA
ncbi:MAG: cobalamin biosynthesis protein [Alkalilacustris sp.]